MSPELLKLIGLIPALIFPAASLVQLLTILKRRQADGVSLLTWVMVGVANVSLFVYTQKYTDVLTIMALLGTAVLNFTVALTAWYYQRQHQLSS
ncbi:MAG: hypothetical protein ACWA5X_10310 [bacterium]